MLDPSLRWLRGRSREGRSIRREIKRRLGVLDPLRLHVYGGYAGPAGAVVWGRALEDETPSQSEPGDTMFDNIIRALRQFESDEVPGVELRLELAGRVLPARTDAEGYFCVELGADHGIVTGSDDEAFLRVRAEVTQAPAGAHVGDCVEGQVLVPRRNARFAVVSDIDDTILKSHVRSRFKQAYVTLVGNALQRKSFPGTAELYQGLRAAGGGAPFFYLSRSAWNVHALLLQFIHDQGLPAGPVILRDVDLFPHREPVHGHKRCEIDRILKTFPELPLVLVGDSGQADADIYADVARAHAGRVRAILIRSISSRRSAERLRERLGASCPEGTQFAVFEQASEAAEHCRAWGLCSEPAA